MHVHDEVGFNFHLVEFNQTGFILNIHFTVFSRKMEIKQKSGACDMFPKTFQRFERGERLRRTATG